jgi:hypothetical protein
MAGSREASEDEEVVPEWWPPAIAKGRGRENAGSSSGWTLAEATRVVGATRIL